VEVAAEHADARAPGDWRGAPLRSALDARACQPLPQVRGRSPGWARATVEAACQQNAQPERWAQSGAGGGPDGHAGRHGGRGAERCPAGVGGHPYLARTDRLTWMLGAWLPRSSACALPRLGAIAPPVPAPGLLPRGFAVL
jgi:hypothetical protein